MGLTIRSLNLILKISVCPTVKPTVLPHDKINGTTPHKLFSIYTSLCAHSS